MAYLLHDAEGKKYRTHIQVEVSSRVPSLLHRAAVAAGDTSNASYIRRVLCEHLAAELGVDAAELLAEQPRPRALSQRTVEDVV
jgi:hypothetical protein